ncbi:MAG: hypothetical protein GC192_22165 [Bacteroidetes bacterium]|nr:hypothetical protein [Bacteroidota bacterium]
MEEYNYPPSDSHYSKWLQNYTPKAIELAATIGFSSQETDKLTLITNALVFSDERAGAYETARFDFIRTRQVILNGDETNPVLATVDWEQQPAVVVAPDPAPANVKAFIQNLVVRTRACPALSEMKKKEMGVLPKPRTTPEAQAILKGSVVNGQPVLTATLYGQKGFEIWRRVTGTPSFAYFDRSAGNTYTDDSSLPDGLAAVQYDYQVRLIGDDNVPVTDFSSIVTLTKTA